MLSTTALRFIIGRKARDAVMGGTRPFSRADRNEWQLVANHWRRSGWMLSAEILRIAADLGRDPYRPRGERECRAEFARRLRAVGESRPAFTPDELTEGRIRALTKSELRSGGL